ncbi:MAG: restriction endonuclease subunit M, partial [Bacteroidaceae bacterium]|nr:restriction endonuclease subunit M [Bacteroidaceae bacterium]
MPFEVDILEDNIYRLSPELLNTLLKDHTTSEEGIQH